MGFAIGMDSPVAFTFIAEISNLKHKGRNVNYWQVVWYVAIVTSALVVIAFFMLGAGAHLWRYAVGFGAFIAFVLYILRIKYLHESPTWVINHYSLEKATEFIRKYYHKDIHLEGTLDDDLNSDVTSPHNSWTDLFKPRYIKELSWRLRFQHYKVCSTMVLVLYIPIIATYLISKEKIGVLLGTAIVNIAGILGAYLGAQLTYKLGTRKLTMIGFTLVLLSMVCVGLFYHHLPMLLNTFLIGLFLFGHSGGPGTQGKTIGALSFPHSFTFTSYWLCRICKSYW